MPKKFNRYLFLKDLEGAREVNSKIFSLTNVVLDYMEEYKKRPKWEPPTKERIREIIDDGTILEKVQLLEAHNYYRILHDEKRLLSMKTMHELNESIDSDYTGKGPRMRTVLYAMIQGRVSMFFYKSELDRIATILDLQMSKLVDTANIIMQANELISKNAVNASDFSKTLFTALRGLSYVKVKRNAESQKFSMDTRALEKRMDEYMRLYNTRLRESYALTAMFFYYAIKEDGFNFMPHNILDLVEDFSFDRSGNYLLSWKRMDRHGTELLAIDDSTMENYRSFNLWNYSLSEWGHIGLPDNLSDAVFNKNIFYDYE